MDRSAWNQPRLVFTEKLIKESMRVFPAAWLVPREALHDVEIGGWRIARGTQLLICTYLVHHDPRWYPDPERFDPERWSDDFTHQLPKLAYLPFGGGPRTCIGNGFAMLGLTITTAAVARRVRFELVDRLPEPPRVSFMLRPRGGMHLRVRHVREHATEEACA